MNRRITYCLDEINWCTRKDPVTTGLRPTKAHCPNSWTLTNNTPREHYPQFHHQEQSNQGAFKNTKVKWPRRDSNPQLTDSEASTLATTLPCALFGSERPNPFRRRECLRDRRESRHIFGKRCRWTTVKQVYETVKKNLWIIWFDAIGVGSSDGRKCCVRITYVVNDSNFISEKFSLLQGKILVFGFKRKSSQNIRKSETFHKS